MKYGAALSLLVVSLVLSACVPTCENMPVESLRKPEPAIPESFIPQRADPFIHRTPDGHYYFIATAPEFDRIELRTANSLPELANAEAKTVWRKHSSGAMGANIWAPELHYPASWHKLPQPVFSTNETLNRYGPGHNSFTLADDGQTDIMVYHARDYFALQGTPLTDPNRHTYICRLEWTSEGFPDFGQAKTD